jgi:Sigma-70 region 2/L,D-transpeptidase catalytic domain
MTELVRDEEFSAFVLASRPELLRSACLLTAGDWHAAEDLVQVALAKLYVAWPRVRPTGSQVAYAWRILVNAHVDEVRRPRWRREQSVAAPPDTPDDGALAAFADGLDGGDVRAALAPHYISTSYGVPIPYAVFFAAGGVAFHQGSLTTSSHGCIHLTMAAARYYNEQLPVGAEVAVF